MALVILNSKFRSDVSHHILVGGKRQLNNLGLIFFFGLNSWMTLLPVDAVTLQQERTELLLLVLAIV